MLRTPEAATKRRLHTAGRLLVPPRLRPYARRLRKEVASLPGDMVRRIAGGIGKMADGWIESRIDGSRKATARRLAAGKVRTLWGVTPILTLPLKARADRMLGFESKSIVFVTYVITRSFDINLERAFRLTARLSPYLLPVLQKLVLGVLLRRYDVFHFFFDRGILSPDQRFGIRLDELDILRRAGKRVYVYAYGADVRQRQKTLSLGRWNFCRDCPEPGKFCICDDEAGARTIAAVSARVTATVALGDMISYAPGCHHLHYWPIDTDNIPLPSPRRPEPKIRIAHAPNHTHFKGSHYLEQAIETLRTEGHDIEYVKVQGVPNEQVIRLFEQADVVADQFIGGAYGYTALEAMARGKPVLTYVRSRDLLEAPEECPLINTTPDTLLEVLRWLLANRDRLAAIGAQGRVYVEKWHSIDAVAERLGRLYEDTAGFPVAVKDKIAAQRQARAAVRAGMAEAKGWQHPWVVA